MTFISYLSFMVFFWKIGIYENALCFWKANMNMFLFSTFVTKDIRGQTDGNHNHRQLAHLITWTTALSNSMKPSHAVWDHPRQTGHGGEV